MGQDTNSRAEGCVAWQVTRKQMFSLGLEWQAQDLNCHSQSVNEAGVGTGSLLGGPLALSSSGAQKGLMSGHESQHRFLGLAKGASPAFGSPGIPVLLCPSGPGPWWALTNMDGIFTSWPQDLTLPFLHSSCPCPASSPSDTLVLNNRPLGLSNL